MSLPHERFQRDDQYNQNTEFRKFVTLILCRALPAQILAATPLYFLYLLLTESAPPLLGQLLLLISILSSVSILFLGFQHIYKRESAEASCQQAENAPSLDLELDDAKDSEQDGISNEKPQTISESGERVLRAGFLGPIGSNKNAGTYIAGVESDVSER